MIRPRTSTATLSLGFAILISNPATVFAQNESVSPLPPASLLIESTEARATNDVASLPTIAPSVIDAARSISDPAERSLALQRIGRSATFSEQLKEAEEALVESGNAADQIPDRVLRDIRLTSVVTALLTLAEEQIRYAGEKMGAVNQVSLLPAAPPRSGDNVPEALPFSNKPYFDAAEKEYELAAGFVRKLNSMTYRSEAMYKVVESQSSESEKLVGIGSPRTSIDFNTNVDPDNPPARPTPDANSIETAKKFLIMSSGYANEIDRPVWRNRAIKNVVEYAATARQFEIGLQVARTIPQPDIRGEALIRLAQAEARQNRSTEATRTYSEAAESIASITQRDLRAIIANVLVDSLVTNGRFDDARACVDLFPYEWQKSSVLGAVAESQGRRGLSESAYRWINNEAPPQYRSLLYRRVSEGVLDAVKQNRSRENKNADRG